jgi:hypothetical protein
LPPRNQILAIRRIIQQSIQRRRTAANLFRIPEGSRRVTESEYETADEHQKLLVEKADLVQARLTFIVTALRRLFAVEELPTFAARRGYPHSAATVGRADRIVESLISDPVKMAFGREA